MADKQDMIRDIKDLYELILGAGAGYIAIDGLIYVDGEYISYFNNSHLAPYFCEAKDEK